MKRGTMADFDALPKNLKKSLDVCPLCGHLKRAERTICGKCRTDATKRWTPNLLPVSPVFAKPVLGNCDTCPCEEDCKQRLLEHPRAWVLCEIPDELDMLGVADAPFLIQEVKHMMEGQR